MINWVGGKGRLANWIIDHFPDGYQDMVYVEPFGGAAWVLLNKEPSSSEVYNDIDENLVNLFRVVRDNPKKFYDLLSKTLRSKAEHDRGWELLKSGSMSELDPIHRALYFALTYVLSYGGNGSGFRRYKEGWVKKRKNNSAGADIRSLRNKIGWVSKRLENVTIDDTNWEHCINLYDSNITFFYIDPPYMYKNLYKHEFTIKDHEALRDKLHKIKGKFLLSYYPTDLITEWYKDYNFDIKQSATTVNKDDGRMRKIEVLIYNYNKED